MTKDEAVYRLRNAAWLGSDEDREATEQAVDMAIEALSATREWVPVSKRLPDKYDEYLCQDADGDRFVGWLEDKEWCKKIVARLKIVAWMPLPERTKES